MCVSLSVPKKSLLPLLDGQTRTHVLMRIAGYMLERQNDSETDNESHGEISRDRETETHRKIERSTRAPQRKV